MRIYYNDVDRYCCQWLRNLIAVGELPEGEVDERPIQEVSPQDVEAFDQCHFFAGIGGWARALQLADWRGPCWTASIPCQPLSSAGKKRGHVDERHLWPALYGLVAECAPAILFGEQVASKLGREWISGVRADLEATGYACGVADLCAAGAGSPHIRQRIWWGAQRLENPHRFGGYEGGDQARPPAVADHTDHSGAVPGGRLEHPEGGRLGAGPQHQPEQLDRAGGPGRVADTDRQREPRRPAELSGEGDGAAGAGASLQAGRRGGAGRVGNPDGAGRPQREHERGGDAGAAPALAGQAAEPAGDRREAGGLGDPAGEHGAGPRQSDPSGGSQEPAGGPGVPGGRLEHPDRDGCAPRGEAAAPARRGHAVEPAGRAGSPWAEFDLVACRDGTARRIEPGTFPLAHGLPAYMGWDGPTETAPRQGRPPWRNGMLKGYGNAIVPEVAAHFIREIREAMHESSV